VSKEILSDEALDEYLDKISKEIKWGGILGGYAREERDRTLVLLLLKEKGRPTSLGEIIHEFKNREINSNPQMQNIDQRLHEIRIATAQLVASKLVSGVNPVGSYSMKPDGHDNIKDLFVKI
jgi:hypothetical protein